MDLTQTDTATGLTSTAIGWTDAMGMLAFDVGRASGPTRMDATRPGA